MQLILTVLLALIGVCLSCLQNCLLCNTNNNKCEQCNNGYFLESTTGECNKCSIPCLECNSSWSCTVCDSGYVLYNGSCDQCSSHCEECISSSICTSCQSGYYMYYSTCYPCRSWCLDCNLHVCTSCASGYYLYNGGCKQCGSLCLECNSSSSCISCISGYNLTNGQCNRCGTTCLICSNSTGDCVSCSQKFYLTGGICVACGTYCTVCNRTTGFCAECEQGYYGEKCQFTCNDLCNGNTCESVSGKCIDGCSDGYYQLENECEICPSNCFSCQNSSRCTGCKADHHLETLTDGSVVCSLSDDTCSACIEANCFNQESPFSASTAGIAVGAFFVGFIVGMIVIYAIQVLLRKRKTETHLNYPSAGNPKVSIPTVHYVNTRSLNNTIEAPDSSFTYESLSDRPDERHYSTLIDAS